MHYLRDGLKLRRGWAGSTRSSPAIAALTTTPFTQPNSIAVVLAERVRRPHLGRPAIVIAMLAWLVIIGGIKSIGRAAEKLSPLKVGLYLVGGLFVIVRLRRDTLPEVFALIFREAFSTAAAAGGTAGIVHDERDALRPRPRHLRQRGRLRHRRRGLRDGAERASPCSRG